LPVSRAAGRGRPAGDVLHDHAADQQDMPVAAVEQGKASRGETVLLRGDRGRRRLLRGPLQVDVFAPGRKTAVAAPGGGRSRARHSGANCEGVIPGHPRRVCAHSVARRRPAHHAWPDPPALRHSARPRTGRAPRPPWHYLAQAHAPRRTEPASPPNPCLTTTRQKCSANSLAKALIRQSRSNESAQVGLNVNDATATKNWMCLGANPAIFATTCPSIPREAAGVIFLIRPAARRSRCASDLHSLN
jgi:hypothetical protein